MAEKKKTYAQLESELSDVMHRIESADYEDLDQLLKDYDSGTAIINELEKKLKSAKTKITQVIKK